MRFAINQESENTTQDDQNQWSDCWYPEKFWFRWSLRKISEVSKDNSWHEENRIKQGKINSVMQKKKKNYAYQMLCVKQDA